MSKKKTQAKNRNKQQPHAKPTQQRRVAVQQDGNKLRMFEQTKGRSYDAEMIGTFYKHLLLELRVQQYENIKALRALKATGDMSARAKAAEELSPGLVEQFQKFQSEHLAALLAEIAIDGEGTSEQELKDFTMALLQRNIERRDTEIGHLEALRSLFDEALTCASSPFGPTSSGEFLRPAQIYRVREFIDQVAAEKVPPYGLLKPQFDGHHLATEAGIEELQRAKVITATTRSDEPPLVLFGRDEIERAKAAGADGFAAMNLRVNSPDELQFVLAAIIHIHGRIDYRGDIHAAF
jgi:hypothetical protein